MSVSEATTADPPAAVPVNVRWTLLGVMLAMLLAVLDTNVVGTAMPTIVGDLGGLGHISWVVTTYALTTAVATRSGASSAICTGASACSSPRSRCSWPVRRCAAPPGPCPA